MASLFANFFRSEENNLVSQENKKVVAEIFNLVDSTPPDFQRLDSILRQDPSLVNCKDEEGATPLIHAVKSKNFSALLFLISHGADPNIEDGSGYNSLFHSIAAKDYHMMTFLLINGADPNYKNKYNITPLEKAIETRDLISVELLIKFGAELTPTARELMQNKNFPTYFIEKMQTISQSRQNKKEAAF